MTPPNNQQKRPRAYNPEDSNVRLPMGVEIGPVTTVANVLASYPKDHPSYRPLPDGQPDPVIGPPVMGMANFTPHELYSTLSAMLNAADDKKEGPDEPPEKPFFGPERPPHL